MPPLLSIITVVKDDLAGLEATRASIRAQQQRDFDWLVADGGSRDGCAAALAGWAAELAWWDSRPDGGPFAGMNRAMAEARGRYLLFLNAGDRLAAPDTLARLAPLLRTERPDLAYGHAYEDPGDGRPRLKPSRHWRWAWYGMVAHHCALVYRRAHVASLRYPTDLRIAGDQAFTLQALAGTARILRLDLPVARFAPGGVSRRQAALGRAEQDRLRRTLLGMPAPLSAGIRLVQTATAGLRHLAPATYARLRFHADQPSPEKMRGLDKPNCLPDR